MRLSAGSTEVRGALLFYTNTNGNYFSVFFYILFQPTVAPQFKTWPRFSPTVPVSLFLLLKSGDVLLAGERSARDSDALTSRSARIRPNI
jgi:hypothetical protein